jgi:type IV pilus assembly protein PilY1
MTIPSESRRSTARESRHLEFELGLGFLALSLWATSAEAGVISQTPMFLRVSAPPAVILGIDDSSSMGDEITLSGGTGAYRPFGEASPVMKFLFPDGQNFASGVTFNVPPLPEFADARCYCVNIAYFNPSDTYTPWPTYDTTQSFPAYDDTDHFADISWDTDTAPHAAAAPWDPVHDNPSASGSTGGAGDTFNLKNDIRKTGNGFTFNANFKGPYASKQGVFVPFGVEYNVTNSASNWKTVPTGTTVSTWDYRDGMWGARIKFQKLAIKYFPATFYMPHGTTPPESFGWTGATVTHTAHDGKQYDRYEIKSGNFESTAKYQDAIQNFANWFTYYRRRHAATRGAVGAAFEELESLRLGIFKIHELDLDLTLTNLTNTSGKNALLENVYEYFKPGGSSPTDTPNMEAANYMGQQFSRATTTPKGKPYDDGVPIIYECQKNAGILYTDGYSDPVWFGAGVGNADGGKGQPYQDDVSNTLADIAMHYYTTNLGPSFPAGEVKVPAACDDQDHDPSLDCNADLHMNFYAVTLGAKGHAYGSLTGAQTAYTNPPDWPTETQLQDNAALEYRQDDLWHATINAHGMLLNASKPLDIRDKLQEVLNSIADRSGSAAAVAATSAVLSINTLVFQAEFDSKTWSGDVSAYAFEDGSLDTAQPVWQAADKIPSHDQRRILTYNPVNNCDNPGQTGGTLFEWGNLNCKQQALLNAVLGTTDDLGEQRVDYLRGDQSQEQTNGPFRKRSGLLGDVVNSNPIYVGTQSFGYNRLDESEGGGDAYLAFVDAKKSRTPALYVGGNDGMLHAFNADNDAAVGGTELFAFVPNGVYTNLSLLTSPEYTGHRYFVDGSSWVGDAYLDSAWKSVLVGTTGAGGRSVFALDVTDPASPSVLWELTDENDGNSDNTLLNLGYTLPQPHIVHTNSNTSIQAKDINNNSVNADFKWVAVVANGYVNSTDNYSGKAVLFIIDLATGARLEIDTEAAGLGDDILPKNGLSTPVVIDYNQDLKADWAYAGDLAGNLWKFDLTSSNPGNWKVAISSGGHPGPLFVACTVAGPDCSPANRQPITGKPQVGRVGSEQSTGVMVFFGTGKYFEDNDSAVVPSPQVQTFYGLWDKQLTPEDTPAPIDSRGRLVQQTVTEEVTADGNQKNIKTTAAVRLTSDNVVNYASQPPDLGWYIDLPSSGERVVTDPLLYEDRIIFSTFLPSDDACGYGGEGWIMQLDAVTGRRVADGQATWDVNGDGDANGGDAVNNHSVSGLKTEGIPDSPRLVRDNSVNHVLTSQNATDRSIRDDIAGTSNDKTGRMSWRQIR